MTTDKEILTLIARDPRQGFKCLMNRYKEPVYWHIRRLVVAHEDAQDATQETFVRIYKALTTFHGEPTAFKSWIYRIATNEALRLVNQRHSENVSLDDTPAEAWNLMADEYVDYSDLEAVRLQQAIHALPTKQQLAFNLRYYSEMSYDEIAQVMDSTPDSAKSSYHIAKEKIINFMNLNPKQ